MFRNTGITANPVPNHGYDVDYGVLQFVLLTMPSKLESSMYFSISADDSIRLYITHFPGNNDSLLHGDWFPLARFVGSWLAWKYSSVHYCPTTLRL
jgi:hypothetical protein